MLGGTETLPPHPHLPRQSQGLPHQPCSFPMHQFKVVQSGVPRDGLTPPSDRLFWKLYTDAWQGVDHQAVSQEPPHSRPAHLLVS